ncbi:MAG TPA: CopG family transcriptional regulator [Dehalococcoidia bacterium]|nr:CopG family transcriptional regulator [Dehalococcoidia bacterium]
MKRTTLSLPEELIAFLKREARRRDTSVSQIAREAIEERFTRKRGARRLGFIALGRSGFKTTAADMEELMMREWTPDRDR